MLGGDGQPGLNPFLGQKGRRIPRSPEKVTALVEPDRGTRN